MHDLSKSGSCMQIWYYYKSVFFLSVPVDILQIATSGPSILGHNYTLTCKALVADYLCPFVSYRWTKENGTVTQPENRTITFSPLRLSNGGQYTCHVTVCSFRFNNEVTVTKTHELIIQSKSIVILFSLLAVKMYTFRVYVYIQYHLLVL